MKPKIYKTEQQWKKELTPIQFQVTQKGATEKPFTGEYWDSKEKGLYRCVCCDTKLFTSKDKYDSGLGWPTFKRPIYEEALLMVQRDQGGERFIQVKCDRCHALLGHFFDDGPPPAFKRYTINSVSLKFEPSSAFD